LEAVLSRLEVNLQKSFSPGTDETSDSGFVLNIYLQCEAGITVLFGASGAGKTLTLDALAGFYTPDEGRIVLDGAILFDAGSGACLPTQRRSVGYVFQNYALFPHLTVEQNLAFGIRHLPAVERGRRIHEQLSRFGIAAKINRFPRELSGGEKQRASIARALICQPKLLLLDEPVRGLDYPLRAEFYEILRRVREEHQIPILLVTHDAEEAYLLADRIAVLENGRIVQFAEPSTVFEEPGSPSVARLLGTGNIFSGRIESLDPMAGVTRIQANGFGLTLPYLPGRLRGDQLEFCIHKEGIRLHDPNSSIRGGDNVFPARIATESFLPKAVKLGLALDESKRRVGPEKASSPLLESEMSRPTYESLQLDKDRKCLVEVPACAVHVFPPSKAAAATPART
jgi:molybdate transport system ATP-binding protein